MLPKIGEIPWIQHFVRVRQPDGQARLVNILALESILIIRKHFLGHVKKFDGSIYFVIFCVSGISFGLGKFLSNFPKQAHNDSI